MTKLSSVGHLCLIIALSFITMMCFTQAGFMGIGMCALGLLCSPTLLLSINVFGALCTASSYLTNMDDHIIEDIAERINKLVWASRNYMLFFSLINTSGIFFINLISIGLFCVIGQISSI